MTKSRLANEADTIHGRFNGNNVDLNRNWDCQWEPTGVWQKRVVSAGATPFSEVESQHLRDYLLALKPDAVIFLHSAANAVYVAGCGSPDATSLSYATVYGKAAEYPVFETFDAYKITGDAGDWLTRQGIPNFSVELTNHEQLDWSRNLAGLRAFFEHLILTK